MSLRGTLSARRTVKDDATLQQLDIEDLMTRPQFRRWFLRLMGRSGIFATTYGPHQRDSDFREGRRALGLELLDEISAQAPDALVRLLSEPLLTTQEPKHDRSDPLASIRDDAPDAEPGAVI